MLTDDQQREIDKALEKEIGELDEVDDIIELDDIVTDPEPSSDPAAEPVTTSESDITLPAETDAEIESIAADADADVTNTDSEIAPIADTATETIEKLRKLINTQNQMILDLKSNIPAPIVQETDKAEAAQPAAVIKPAIAPAANAPIDYIGNLDMDDVSADKDIFNEIINKAVMSAVDAVTKQNIGIQDTLSKVPASIQQHVRQQSYIDNAVNIFYKENPDLSSIKETVSQVAQGIASEHPDYDLPKLFKKVAKTTRSLLRMPLPQTESEKTETDKEFTNPAFAAQSSTRRLPEKISELQADIDAL